MVKICDILAARDEQQNPLISFEYFPPKTEKGVALLYDKFESMKKAEPIFYDITWGAGGSTSELTVEIADRIENKVGLPANMHLTCTNMPFEKVDEALNSCRQLGIQNIVALRGDPPEGQEAWKAAEGGFACAMDLVRYIRSQPDGDRFCISVAGYPEGHPNRITEYQCRANSPASSNDATNLPTVAEVKAKLTPAELARCAVRDDGGGKWVVSVCLDADYVKEMEYLKAKVDAGADMIITQMFLDVEVFFAFVKDCRKYGIQVPILPGIICISSYPGFAKMIKLCKTRVPAQYQQLLAFANDVDKSYMDAAAAASAASGGSAPKLDAAQKNFAVKKAGVEIGTEMCQRLFDSKVTPCLHFYTLNMEKASFAILENLGLYSPPPKESAAAAAAAPASKDMGDNGGAAAAPAVPVPVAPSPVVEPPAVPVAQMASAV